MQRTQAQRRGSDQSVVSNWNGTVELPVYNFGEEVLQEGSFGKCCLETPASLQLTLPDLNRNRDVLQVSLSVNQSIGHPSGCAFLSKASS